jgi:glucose/arabinose dehydrogenase
MAYKLKILLAILLLALLGWVIYVFIKKDEIYITSLTPTTTPVATNTPAPSIKYIPAFTTVATDLNIPWDLAFLPSGEILVTERPGNLVLIKSNGEKTSIKLPRPVPKGEGGLLGIVLHPDFSENSLLYLYMTTSESQAGTKNSVFQYRYSNGVLEAEKVIVKDIPGAIYHDGGRMEFGPDGYLYITTGDATKPDIAQDTKSLGGKILRINADGTIPKDNPFGNAVYSYGHRNPQGLAWDAQGTLYETEHGRSGVTSGMDEFNVIIAGKNYGWPKIEGDVVQNGMETPLLNSGALDTWAPASLAYYPPRNSFFFGGLRGEALYEVFPPTRGCVDASSCSVTLEKYLFQKYGRIRTVRFGPDGMLYITTSNRDGRGQAMSGDDKIIKIDPNALK